MRLAEKSRAELRGEGSILVFHKRNLLKCEITAGNSLILRTIILENELIVGDGLEIFQIVGCGHIGSVLTAFQSVVGEDVSYEKLTVVSSLILPHKRSVSSVHYLNRSLGACEEIAYSISHRAIFTKPSVTSGEWQKSAHYQFLI